MPCPYRRNGYCTYTKHSVSSLQWGCVNDFNACNYMSYEKQQAIENRDRKAADAANARDAAAERAFHGSIIGFMLANWKLIVSIGGIASAILQWVYAEIPNYGYAKWTFIIFCVFLLIRNFQDIKYIENAGRYLWLASLVGLLLSAALILVYIVKNFSIGFLIAYCLDFGYLFVVPVGFYLLYVSAVMLLRSIIK